MMQPVQVIRLLDWVSAVFVHCSTGDSAIVDAHKVGGFKGLFKLHTLIVARDISPRCLFRRKSWLSPEMQISCKHCYPRESIFPLTSIRVGQNKRVHSLDFEDLKLDLIFTPVCHIYLRHHYCVRTRIARPMCRLS
jgi:hypothetical protein